MTRLWLIRHAPTQWNADKRLQGRSDQPLCADGMALASRWRLPAELSTACWVSSPLRRARETAEILARQYDPIPKISVDPRLTEWDFGAWEGQKLADLRAQDPTVAQQEARGLDLLPPGGESPRMVQARVRGWLLEAAARGEHHVAITHKGVIRAIFALATGWSMLDKSPVKLRLDHVQEFSLDRQGWPTMGRLNIPLVTEDAR